MDLISNGIMGCYGETSSNASLDRFLYTVIGDAVNIAARLEALTREYPGYPVLINKAAYEAVKSRAELRLVDLGPCEVKGRMEKVDVYGVAYSGGFGLQRSEGMRPRPIDRMR